MPNVSFEDFESDAFRIFRKKAISSTRLSKDDLDMGDLELLESLQLTEPDYIKRAAILLFHQNPEKWVPGAYVKIGMFATDTELKYHHEVHGSLIAMPDKIMEIVYSNYFKGIISYEGIQRVETWNVPHEAFREAITNAIVHRDYSTGIPIQIKVYPDKVVIHNDGNLRSGWSSDEAIKRPRSRPHNPLIANTFFRCGQIESWGRGIKKMSESCVLWNKPQPTIEFLYDSEFTVTFESGENYSQIMDSSNEQFTNNFTEQFTEQFTINDLQKRICSMIVANPNISIKTIASEIGITDRHVKGNIKTLKELGLIERIGTARKGKWVIKNT